MSAAVFTPPIVIDPSALSGVDSMPKMKPGRRFVLGEFTDASSKVRADSVIGQTRTGRKTTSLIKSDPLPAEAVKRTLEAALRAQGALAEGGGGDFLVSVKVMELKLTETSRAVHQVISASLKVEVVVTAPDDPERVVRTFRIESSGERTARDTSKYALPAARDAVTAAVEHVLKSLDSL